MKNTLVIKIVVLLLIASASLKAQNQPVVMFEQTPCFGSCAVFQLRIFNDRRMTLHAIKYVKEGEGNLKSRMKKRDYRKLIELFNEKEFFNLKDEYTSRSTDLPTRYVTFNNKGQSKKILDYANTPAELKEIENVLFEIISESKWKKSD